MRTVRLTLLCTAALLLVAAAPSQARRKAPRYYMGAQFANAGLVNASDKAQDAQFALMARSGVETVRCGVNWGALEPRPGVYDFSSMDRLVRVAARHGLAVLPTVGTAPGWDSTQPNRQDFWVWPDTSTAGTQRYATFLRALIGRYGPRGSFWSANRRVPKIAIRYWQIWNEPGFRFFWGPANFAVGYTRLLKAAYRAVHRADRGAKVVMAGLANGPQPNAKASLSWNDLAALYRQGARRYFDVLALHPFGVNFRDSVRIVDENIKVKKRYHDARKPIWLTEFFYTASKGKGARPVTGLEVTTGQQKLYTKQAYTYYATHKSAHVQRIYWEPWESSYGNQVDAGQPSFNYAGLVAFQNGRFRAMPVLSTYAAVARKLEGCRKTSDARRCAR